TCAAAPRVGDAPKIPAGVGFRDGPVTYCQRLGSGSFFQATRCQATPQRPSAGIKCSSGGSRAGTEGPGGAGVEAEVWRRRREWPRTHNPISVPHDRAKTGARLTPREPTGFIARVVPRDAVDGRCDSERDCGRVGAAVSQRCDTKGGQGVAGACRNRTYQGPFGPQLVLKTSRTTRPDPPPCTTAAAPRHCSEAGSRRRDPGHSPRVVVTEPA